MNKPAGYDKTESKQYGESQRPSAGGHVGIIMGAKSTSSRSGKEMIVLEIDLENGYYTQMGANVNRNCLLRYYQLTEGNSLPFFKGMVTSIEKSNPGYSFMFDEKTLAGKKIGIVLQEEEYLANDGKIKASLKIAQVRSIDNIENAKVLPTKKLTQEDVAPQETTANIDDLPF